jgi:Putative death-receptor fusion protein (DUF2428)
MSKGNRLTTVPIALPHDGPLSLLISQNKSSGTSISDDEVLTKIVELDETIADGCIMFLLRANYGDKDPTDAGLFSDKINLLYLLIHASHIHDQLQALQKFRNKIIQKQSRVREQVEIDSLEMTGEQIADRKLYRILLEWMISVRTPVPLRRALASCLSVLLPPLPRENDDHGTLIRNNVPFDVLESILQPSYNGSILVVYWRNPLHSLYELLAWGSAEEFFNTDACIIKIMKFLQSQTVCRNDNEDCDVDNEITLMANLINKILICAVDKNQIRSQSLCDELHGEIVADLQLYLWNSILCHDIPIDRLANVGIAYGRTVQWQLLLDNTSTSSTMSAIFEAISTMASVLQRAAVLQGLAVVVPMHSSSVLELMVTCRRIFVEAADPDVRGLALKGVRTLISRIHTWYSNTSTNFKDIPFTNAPKEIWLDVDDIRQVVDETLHVVLQAWENPPTRNLANAISALFENLIQLLIGVSAANSLDGLTERLLAQAPNVKCRYLALEVLMPIAGASRLVKSNPRLLQDLLMGIGDQGHNTGVIADLWANLLKHMYIESNEQIRISANEGDGQSIPSDWLELWSPSLVCALSSKDFTRRKQVAAFCLPRIFALEFSNTSRPIQMALIVNSLFSSVKQLWLDKSISRHRRSVIGETIGDRILWVELEIIRYAAAEGLLKLSLEGANCIRDIVAATLPKSRLQSGLVHELPSIRIAALQVIGSVVTTYGNAAMFSLDFVRSEVELWMFALPSSIKTDGKEHILAIHQCLLLFLDRLLLAEASSFDETKRNVGDVKPLRMFHSFVVDFLVNDILLKKAGYPGTVELKESFLLTLMECLIVFSARDHPLATESKLLPKNLPVFRRRRRDVEECAILEVKISLSSSNLFGCLTTLLHSAWDSTRSGAYRILVSLLRFREMSPIIFPEMCTDAASRTQLLSKGIFLASSPRQREADTGAKLISFMYLSLSSVHEKQDLMASLVDLLDRRLTFMKQHLAALLCNSGNYSQALGLPLAHGIVHALRLVTECSDLHLSLEHIESKEFISSISTEMISLFFRALRVSLAVVADVKNGEILNGMDEDIVLEFDGNRSTTMVNPSAIGANGIFSSVKRFSFTETSKRLASQRIVIGSWLLTKETCAAIASILSLSSCKHSPSIYDEAGVLLISTLTALKHTGAAFAAHRALQVVAQNCFACKSNAVMLDLPKIWGLRMIAEISDSEKIRDSILRRSTGYSLGFLSLMRAEVSTQKRHPCCLSLLQDIMRLCLPSRSQWNEFTLKMQFSETLKGSVFPFSIIERHISLVTDSQYNLQARVHALNVLRSCLLDSPIANEVFPFVGLAFIAAMIGFTDSEWSVRNSSTMVFAAAMLRAIDPDKNSLRADVTGCNAITANELFRSFPPLAPFLLAVLNGGIHDTFKVHEAMSLHPVLPILLLFSRIQPISLSGENSMLLVEPFVPVVLMYLSHQQIKIRKGAARAIRNMVSENRDSPTSIYSMLLSFQQSLSSLTNFSGRSGAGCHWNFLHGLLLTIHELVLFFPKAKSCFSGTNLLEDMFLLATVHNGSLRVPHLCAKVAIEIIWHLSLSHDYGRLLLICRGICLLLERMHQLQLCDIGSAELGASVSTILTTLLSFTILNSAGSCDQIGIAIGDLSLLLHSDCSDLRCPSVKTFKKLLGQFLENLPDTNEMPVHFCTIVELLHAAIIHELERDCFNGPHFPSLRRLSRCLVDWVDSHESTLMSYQVKSNFNFDDLPKSLLHRSSLHVFNELDPISISQLNGNALEILNLKRDPLNVEQLKLLFQLVIQLSNPSCYWRVRRSAANSLGRIANELAKDDSIFSPSEKRFLLGAWLALLQDEDFNVRQIASSATMKLCCFPAHINGLFCTQKSTSCTVSASYSSMAGNMFSFLYSISDDVHDKMKATVDKLTHTNDSESFPVFVNDAVMQAIFETENPNSYIELCVTCQLVVIAIVNMTESTSFQMNGDFVASTNTFLKNVYLVLTLLLGWSCDGTVFSNVTCSKSVFPCLHSMLITTLTLIYVVEESFVEMIDDVMLVASNIVSLHLDVGLNHFHPLLCQAMQSFLHAKQSNLHTLETLKQCCFLVSMQEYQ